MGYHLVYAFTDSVFLVVDIFNFLFDLVSWNHDFGAKSEGVVYKSEARTSFLETASGRR